MQDNPWRAAERASSFKGGGSKEREPSPPVPAQVQILDTPHPLQPNTSNTRRDAPVSTEPELSNPQVRTLNPTHPTPFKILPSPETLKPWETPTPEH